MEAIVAVSVFSILWYLFLWFSVCLVSFRPSFPSFMSMASCFADYKCRLATGDHLALAGFGYARCLLPHIVTLFSRAGQSYPFVLVG